MYVSILSLYPSISIYPSITNLGHVLWRLWNALEEGGRVGRRSERLSRPGVREWAGQSAGGARGAATTTAAAVEATAAESSVFGKGAPRYLDR